MNRKMNMNRMWISINKKKFNVKIFVNHIAEYLWYNWNDIFLVIFELPKSSTSHGLGRTNERASSNFKPPSRFSISSATSYSNTNKIGVFDWGIKNTEIKISLYQNSLIKVSPLTFAPQSKTFPASIPIANASWRASHSSPWSLSSNSGKSAKAWKYKDKRQIFL